VRQVIFFVLISLPFLSVRAEEQVRTWTINGRSVEARFLREVDGDVTFLQGNKPLFVPLDHLSDSDQKLVREWEAKKKVEEATTPAGAPAAPESAEGLEAGEDVFVPAAGQVGSLVKKKVVAEVRTWSSADGQTAIGKFVRLVGRDVVISNGKFVASFAYDQLSLSDQQHVNALLQARGRPTLNVTAMDSSANAAFPAPEGSRYEPETTLSGSAPPAFTPNWSSNENQAAEASAAAPIPAQSASAASRSAAAKEQSAALATNSSRDLLSGLLKRTGNLSNKLQCWGLRINAVTGAILGASLIALVVVLRQAFSIVAGSR
jgi:hypothetical protein